METLANLESFVRSAQHRSFSEAARRLSLTPAAVSRNVATLERNLGVRLFQRTTRKLTLTEAGETFRAAIAENLDRLQSAIANVASDGAEPAGTLRVSLPPTLGIDYILPLLPGFLARYPRIRPEWHFEHRAVDIVAEGYDAAIGGGFDLSPGVVARTLAPTHVVAVASARYVKKHGLPADPAALRGHTGIFVRSPNTGRTRHWPMRDAAGREMAADLAESIVLNDLRAVREAVLLGLGIAMLVIPDVLSGLDSGALVRVAPRWYTDVGVASIYHPSRTLLPPKTRVFVDWIVAAFESKGLARRFSAHARKLA